MSECQSDRAFHLVQNNMCFVFSAVGFKGNLLLLDIFFLVPSPNGRGGRGRVALEAAALLKWQRESKSERERERERDELSIRCH